MDFIKLGKYPTVNGLSKAVGISTVSYFIRQFEKEFGQKPMHFLREKG